MPSANKFLVIGHPQDNRVIHFQAALKRQGFPAAKLLSYEAVFRGEPMLEELVLPGTIVRIESPGKQPDTNRLILSLGLDPMRAEGVYRAVSQTEIDRADLEAGQILSTRQWYLGYCSLLDRIDEGLRACHDYRLMNGTDAIRTMFDKCATQRRLLNAGIPTPKTLNPVTNYQSLLSRMKAERCYRVFIKLAHSSSAVGTIAYQTNGKQHKATTTIELLNEQGNAKLYSTRKLRVLRDQKEIAHLIDTLCQDRVHVDQWIPKAAFGDKRGDVRVVVIQDQAQHTVLRLSHTPITNLHLLNERAEEAAIVDACGVAVWQEAKKMCVQAKNCFDGALYAGIDLLFTPDFAKSYILELNAFGDLLYHVRHNGLDTYEAEIQAVTSLHREDFRAYQLS